jgi:hypothetical protein
MTPGHEDSKFHQNLPRVTGGDGDAFQIQGIRAEVLPSLPLDAAHEGFYGIEDARILQSLKNASIQIGPHVKKSQLIIGENQDESVVWVWLHCLDARIHGQTPT